MRKCDNCRNFWEDTSTGTMVCECSGITEQELKDHFTDDNPGCPCWEGEGNKVLSLKQVNRMFEATESVRLAEMIKEGR